MIDEMMTCRGRVGSFGRDTANKMINVNHSVQWWDHFGYSAPHLQSLAILVLGQTSSSSKCERNWSLFERIHTKRRNRLETQRLNDLVFVHYNFKLKKKWKKHQTYFDPIDGENAADIQDWVVVDEEEEEDTPLENNKEIATMLYDADRFPEPRTDLDDGEEESEL